MCYTRYVVQQQVLATPQVSSLTWVNLLLLFAVVSALASHISTPSAPKSRRGYPSSNRGTFTKQPGSKKATFNFCTLPRFLGGGGGLQEDLGACKPKRKIVQRHKKNEGKYKNVDKITAFLRSSILYYYRHIAKTKSNGTTIVHITIVWF